MDMSGNILREKKIVQGTGMHEIAEDAEGEDKWEVVSSDSVIQRRKLQEATDWPLSARGIEEKRLIAEKHKGKDNLKSRIAQGEKVDVSNEWSWDAEKESDISQWLGMPKEEFKQSHSFGDDSGVMSEVDIVELDDGKRNSVVKEQVFAQ